MIESIIIIVIFVGVVAYITQRKSLIGFIRDRSIGEDGLSNFDKEHYAKFEKALELGDVEAYVYEINGLKGQVICLKGDDLHAVTPKNLISFRKLNRKDSRYLRSKYKLDLHENKLKSKLVD